MPRDKQYETPAERQKAYRERQAKGLQPDGETPIPQAPKTHKVKRADLSVPQLVALARAGTIELTSGEETQIRFEFGYAPSENRTLLTRDPVAARIKAASPPVGKTVVRYALDGSPVEEPVGPAGLSLVAFPNQR